MPLESWQQCGKVKIETEVFGMRWAVMDGCEWKELDWIVEVGRPLQSNDELIQNPPVGSRHCHCLCRLQNIPKPKKIKCWSGFAFTSMGSTLVPVDGGSIFSPFSWMDSAFTPPTCFSAPSFMLHAFTLPIHNNCVWVSQKKC